MNLIQRIIVWLATRFLTNGSVVDLFIEKILAKEDATHTLRTLFNRHNNTVPGDKKNLNFIAVNHLYNIFGTHELAKLLFFKSIKEQRVRCADAACDESELDELLVKLRDNIATNPMKRLSTFKQILRTALPLTGEEEIAILAQIAMSTSHTLVANAQFLKEI
jgi:hypothetical protein